MPLRSSRSERAGRSELLTANLAPLGGSHPAPSAMGQDSLSPGWQTKKETTKIPLGAGATRAERDGRAEKAKVGSLSQTGWREPNEVRGHTHTHTIGAAKRGSDPSFVLNTALKRAHTPTLCDDVGGMCVWETAADEAGSQQTYARSCKNHSRQRGKGPFANLSMLPEQGAQKARARDD